METDLESEVIARRLNVAEAEQAAAGRRPKEGRA